MYHDAIGPVAFTYVDRSNGVSLRPVNIPSIHNTHTLTIMYCVLIVLASLWIIHVCNIPEEDQSTMCAPKANSVVKEPESRENVSSFEPCYFSVSQSVKRGKNKSHQKKKKGSFVPGWGVGVVTAGRGGGC